MRLILSTVLLLTIINSHGQGGLKGTWYTISSDMFKVVQYNFDTTSFSSTKLDWKLKTQPGLQIARIKGIIQKREKLYYLLQEGSDTNIVTLLTLSSVEPNKSFIQGTASDKHSIFKTKGEAMAFVETDTLLTPGMIFYSQQEFNRVRSSPDASTISNVHFKLYLQRLIDARINFETFAKKHKSEFGFMFAMAYLPNQARKILADLGYNPVIDDKQLDQVNKKFKDDPELKDLMDRAFNFK